ncbi:MAG: hypothetical protein H7331_10510 [Bacteroidia bacterium]|nr:hypothetical protein [Bacteroidia bacterium]
MKTLKIVALTAMAVIGTVACKKNGTGGKATLAALPQHHGKPIFGATAYIKFNATELPSDPTNNYDLKIVGGKKEDHVHVENLRYGNYYVYIIGYDSSIFLPVKGGIPVKIKYAERAKELDMIIPVKE